MGTWTCLSSLTETLSWMNHCPASSSGDLKYCQCHIKFNYFVDVQGKLCLQWTSSTPGAFSTETSRTRTSSSITSAGKFAKMIFHTILVSGSPASWSILEVLCFSSLARGSTLSMAQWNIALQKFFRLAFLKVCLIDYHNFQGCSYEGPELELWSLGVLLYIIIFGENPFYDSQVPIQSTYESFTPPQIW